MQGMTQNIVFDWIHNVCVAKNTRNRITGPYYLPQCQIFLLMYDINCDFLPIVSEGDSIMTQFIIGRVYFCCCGALFCFPLSASVNLLVFLIYLHFNSVKKPVN
jgi:hypothetical protein